MEFLRLKIPDLILIKPEIHFDDRGYFAETYRSDLLNEFLGKEINFVQDNESRSVKGVLRGLHYQAPPYDQSKLVRVINGSILDIAIDIRRESPTYGHYASVILDAKDKHQLFIPKGFAHGFIVTSDQATFSYKVDNFYSPTHEDGIIFNDETLDIDWKVPKEFIKISEKDKTFSDFSSLISPF